ncbi:hypothetical protein GYMLUDRAFT_65494 [Collybiopsis luxurians FD-317 M1]|uniref:Uncharacterized protein n=1 Tax=Collybiopsis luxurians FD-317 M1 TaxID=944289 RepID=A0A0D0AID9_9AGAR|nr:hypothetical protein GYMLUDRAFT_65494 [Collybiopsis luxurians FD-317 M1]
MDIDIDASPLQENKESQFKSMPPSGQSTKNVPHSRYMVVVNAVSEGSQHRPILPSVPSAINESISENMDVIGAEHVGKKRGHDNDPDDEAPAAKVILFSDEPAWRALKDKYEAVMKKLSENQKLNKALKSDVETLNEEKKSLQEALLGSKYETAALTKTTNALNRSHAALIAKVFLAPSIQCKNSQS